MKQTYYILAIDSGAGYGVECGSYDKSDVLEERDFHCDNHDYYVKNIRVIKTIDDQKAIDQLINKLNSEVSK